MDGAETTVYVWFTKIPLHPLHPWQAQFYCGDLNFWDSVTVCDAAYILAAQSMVAAMQSWARVKFVCLVLT